MEISACFLAASLLLLSSFSSATDSKSKRVLSFLNVGERLFLDVDLLQSSVSAEICGALAALVGSGVCPPRIRVSFV